MSNSTACQSLKHSACCPEILPTLDFMVPKAEMANKSPKFTQNGAREAPHPFRLGREVSSDILLLGQGFRKWDVFSNLFFFSSSAGFLQMTVWPPGVSEPHNERNLGPWVTAWRQPPRNRNSLVDVTQVRNKLYCVFIHFKSICDSSWCPLSHWSLKCAATMTEFSVCDSEAVG